MCAPALASLGALAVVCCGGRAAAGRRKIKMHAVQHPLLAAARLSSRIFVMVNTAFLVVAACVAKDRNCVLQAAHVVSPACAFLKKFSPHYAYAKCNSSCGQGVRKNARRSCKRVVLWRCGRRALLRACLQEVASALCKATATRLQQARPLSACICCEL